MTLTLREIATEDLATIYPLISQLNPTLSKAEFTHLLTQAITRGYRCVGAFETHASEESLIGICGFMVAHRFWCKKHLDLDSFIVHSDHRSKGIGEKIFAWIESYARQEQCEKIGFDAYTHNTASHKLYHRLGYVIEGYHFTKNLT